MQDTIHKVYNVKEEGNEIKNTKHICVLNSAVLASIVHKPNQNSFYSKKSEKNCIYLESMYWTWNQKDQQLFLHGYRIFYLYSQMDGEIKMKFNFVMISMLQKLIGMAVHCQMRSDNLI